MSTLRLSDGLEKLQAQRIESLAILARLRGTLLLDLMNNFSIQIPKYI